LEPARAIPPTDVLCCPRCAGALARASNLDCVACGASFPVIDEIPWLCAEPQAVLAEWRGKLRALVAELDAQAASYREALTDAVTRPATRNRLKLMSGACQDHARRLRSLLAPLQGAQGAAAVETYRALGGALPVGQGLTGYYANLHRDWCWGEAENEAAFSAIDAALQGANPGRLLVLGAGAGRLAYDLHARRLPAVTIAADLNPLMLAVARRMYAAEAVELYEFPVAPRDLDSHAILRRLRAPAAAPAGLHVVLADANRAPFGCGAFDTIVTPWLVDILDEDFATFVLRVRHWLRPGGRWINSGSLFFQHRDPARCYATEEVLEIVRSAGFEAVQVREEPVPYLASPASRHARQERLVTISAVRGDAVHPAPRPHSVLPPWLARLDLPVPLLPEVSSRVLAMRVYAFVASLVDGQRTVRDIADVLVRERLMPADEAESAVRSFLQRLFEEARLPVRP
jgi:SAM-dependent methyltransferase/uncharacterized protein YbaR (Trm112 family)